MDAEGVDNWLKNKYTNVGGDKGCWELNFEVDLEEGLEEGLVFIIADPYHDRIRIIAPIVETWQVDYEDLLKANFHTTMDIRYAVLENVLYATFLHQLSLLSEAEISTALNQVIMLCINTLYGVYMAGDLVYRKAYASEKAEKLRKREYNLKDRLNLSKAMGGKIESKEDLIQLYEKCKTEKDPNKKGI